MVDYMIAFLLGIIFGFALCVMLRTIDDQKNNVGMLFIDPKGINNIFEISKSPGYMLQRKKVVLDVAPIDSHYSHKDSMWVTPDELTRIDN